MKWYEYYSPIKQFNQTKLINKIIILFILATVIPLLIIQSASFILSSRNLSTKIDEIMTNQLITISGQVQMKLEAYRSMIHNIQIDNTIIDNLSQLKGNPQQYAKAYNKIVSKLKQYNTSIQGIRSVSLICMDGSTVIYDVSTDSFLDNIWRDVADLRDTEAFTNALASNLVAITPTTRFNETNNIVPLFHLSKPIYNLNNVGAGPVAVVIVSIHESILNAVCNNMTDQTHINFIMDENRNIISYPNSFFTGFRLDDKHSASEFVKLTGYLKDKHLETNIYFDPATKWYYYNVYDSDYVLKDLKWQQAFFLFVGIGMLLLSVLLIQYVVRKINRSMKGLMEGIQQVQAGNLDTKVPMYSQDEFGEIAANFNEMTDKVKISMINVTKAAEQQRIAELRALEAQINPHFMYNTLDTINWMAIEKGEHEISQALRDFGVILRYSISKSDEIVQLWVVEDWLRKYVRLNQMRFIGVFDFIMKVDDTVKNVLTHKLLVQPFVENAILHGFKGIETGGILRVDITPSEDNRSIIIIIEDNGKGITAERVKELNIVAKDDDSSGRIGIANVFQRIQMYYGDRANWNISSIQDVGTIVTLKIPVSEADYENTNR